MNSKQEIGEKLASETANAIKASLLENPGAIIEHLASEQGVTPLDIIHCLPESQAVSISGEDFEAVMNEIATWGDITFIVHTPDVVFEARGEVPTGSMGRGYFNLHGKPIGGHLKADNCALISFVSRPVFKNDSHSVQFYNKNGGCMFKIYLGRDENREMHPEQIVLFKAYRDRMQTI